ncbi:unnamed protein product [Cuscuta epithymum]|uniref:ubiquitinyl hydrolase 1 n=1 Tax=Cuscuta epithymum TaxID=186058 RepID=A0AAV0GJN9_9ASTE|nr:unnamed protein product [Cuscuta epithymum]CAH9147722.1 unnamed protein product [Cuscuta epithymum]
MNDQESDSGFLSLFHVDKFFYYSYGESGQPGAGNGQQQYADDDTVYTNANEEIAHAFQNQLSITGESGAYFTEGCYHGQQFPSDDGVQSWQVTDDYPESSILVQPGHAPSKDHFSGNNNEDPEKSIRFGPSSSSHPAEDRRSGGEEPNQVLGIKYESEFDADIARRLNEVDAVPLIPRINTHIPSDDETTSHKERLLNRLQRCGLVENIVEGDGNCQFRALSDQFYRMPEHHSFVRQQVVNQLMNHPEMYDAYVPMAYGDYLKRMMEDGEWGDHVTLQAAADLYGVKIVVITSHKETCFIEILPRTQKSNRVIYLSFWAEVHYNSIYPHEGGIDHLDQGINTSEEVNSSYSPAVASSHVGDLKVKKKKWWNFLKKK